jgi:hypothetical protein
MLPGMSVEQDTGGWCLICDKEIGIDTAAHFEKEHPARPRKPKAQILSWSDRIDQIIQSLEKIKASTDTKAMVLDLDENVIKEVYLVRATLAGKLGTPIQRVKEG